MRLAEITTLEAANRFLEITFWPFWNQRFAVPPARNGDAHRRLERSQRLEEILSVRVVRTMGSDHTVMWKGQRWGLQREQVCAGLRGAQTEIEKRLDGTHWLRFRSRYLPLHPCPAASRSVGPSGLGLQALPIAHPNQKHAPKPNTFRLPITPGASLGSGHF